METAYQELRHTIKLAEKDEEIPEIIPDVLQSHIRAIDEDLAILQSYKTEENQKEINEIAMEARRVRRCLERTTAWLRANESNKKSEIQQALVREAPKEGKTFKLHPIKLPIFEGDAPKFRLFYDTFEETVLLNDKIPAMGKWVYLKDSLRGFPLTMISDIPEKPETLKIAIKMLCDKYDDASANVTHLYKKLHDLPTATMQTESLRLTYSRIEGILLSLEQMGHNVDANEYIRAIVIGKLPEEVLHIIVKPRMRLTDIRKELADFVIARESVAREVISTNNGKARAVAASGTWRAMAPQSEKNTRERRFNCLFCSGEHWADECKIVPTIAERKSKLVNRCHRCLRPKHGATPCANIRRCTHCDDTAHNRALCPIKFPEKEEKALMTECSMWGKENYKKAAPKGFFWTLMVTARAENSATSKEIRMVIDPASARSFMTQAAATALKLTKSETQRIKYAGMGDATVDTATAAEQMVSLSTLDNSEVDVGVFIVRQIAADLHAPDTAQFLRDYPQYSRLKIVESGKEKPIDMLLGNDYLVAVLTLNNNIRINEATQLMPTVFGHIIIGNQTVTESQGLNRAFMTTIDSEVRQLWELENIGLAYAEDEGDWSEKKALDRFYETIKYVNGRYEVAWPWAQDKPVLNDNYGLALGRLRSLYKTLKKRPQLLREYDDIMKKQEESEIIEEVDRNEVTDEIIRYIPHHPVITEEKSTKIRPVYDASAKAAKNEQSLNDCLMKGISWLTDVASCLLRFRGNDTALSADIEKAFHQLQIRKEDRNAVRFLWLRNIMIEPERNNIKIMRFKRVAFGLVPSPFLLHATMKFHLKKYKTNTSKIIQRDMYADNLITTLDKDTDPCAFYKETKEIFMSMGMNMTKWASNNSTLIRNIPHEDRNTAKEQTVLGMSWNTESDTLAIKQPNAANMRQTRVTRRMVLRQTASVFDPLGWAAPIVLQAKIYIRKLWVETRTWDETIEAEKQTEWQKIAEELKNVSKIELPRQMWPEKYLGREVELHAFVDASMQACAVVLYAVAINENDRRIAFIMAKTKLTPKKVKSIPRLELLAAVLGVRLLNYAQNALNEISQTKRYLWSDSKCVLTWLATEKLLPTIVHRQVTEIRKSKNIVYNYIPSEGNFADIASRGASWQTLQNMQWWNGPRWLTRKDSWPEQLPLIEPETPTENDFRTLLLKEKYKPNEEGPMGIIAKNFSNITNLLKRTATCVLAINRIMKRDVIGVQQPLDLAKARLIWLRYQQQQNYPEIRDIKVNEVKCIKNIRIFLDEDGIMRMASRLQHAQRRNNEINPVVLVRKTWLTKLIILDIHQRNKHAGTSHTLAAIREKYWLPQGRREVFATIKQLCFVCRRYDAKMFAAPPPAPLPEFRVKRGVKPFQGTGIDICGPFLIRTSNEKDRLREKRWIVVFVCTVIRAVHLEVIHSMTTEEILDAIRRFTSRRGTPRTIVSDNAPQFHVLQGYFVNLWRHLNTNEKIGNYFAQNEIVWKFVPQHSPWMGGLYERIIRSVKTAFEKTYGNIVMPGRQFGTSVIEIEGILNNRPLTYVDRNIETPILTPNHFLQVEFPAIELSKAGEQKPNDVLRLWRASEKHIQQFWEIWSAHYLMTIRDRDDKLRKLRSTTAAEPKPSDIVLVAEPEKKRSAWKLARIQKCIPSADGKIRTVLLKLPNGSSIIRPIIKTAPIGLATEQVPADARPLARDRQAVVVASVEGDGGDHQVTDSQRGETAVTEQAVNRETEADWQDGSQSDGEYVVTEEIVEETVDC